MFKPLQTRWQSAPRPAALGFLLLCCAGIADGALLPFLALWAVDEAAIPVGAVGLLIGCYAAGELLAAPFLGGIADRIGRRPVLIVAALGVGTGIGSLCFVHGTVAAAAVLLLTGIFESVLHPTVMAVIADSTPAHEHRRWFGVASVASGSGHILGPLLGAALALLSLRAVFVVAGGILLLGGLIALLALPETMAAAEAEPLIAEEEEWSDGNDGNDGDDGDDGDDAEDEGEEGLSALMPAFRDGRLARLLLWVLLFEVAGSWIEALIPLYARDAGTLTPSGVGALFAFGAALAVGLQLRISRLTQARSVRWLVLAAGGATASAFIVLALSPALAAMVVAVSLCAVAQMLVGPLVPTAVIALAPGTQRASYLAASSVAVDLRDSLGPALGTMLYALAPTAPWLMGVPFVVIAALGLARSAGRHADAPASAGAQPGVPMNARGG
ncbi:MFS transporter [Mitsuaria sp. 7]|uniref:MFS transporter n=1 Tax=Mitsuaria sp. 7 TaxID=1658665 RepID=UPI0007DCD53C|nr:MFS transporter [Mitsuaria sp. 7]ANH67714.1 transporter, major facilitator family protein [Mitsuaria sp. 7]